MLRPEDLWTRTSVLLVVLSCLVGGEQLLNGGFETMNNWNCWNFKCELVAPGDSRFGAHSLKASGRTQSYMGPSQDVQLKPGTYYKVQSYMKLLNQLPTTIGHTLMLEISFALTDGSSTYITGAQRNMVTLADGWVLMQGDFLTPSQAFKSATFYYQGPEPGVDFVVDQATMTEVDVSSDNWRQRTDEVINRVRKSDINFRVTTPSDVSLHDVRIVINQTKKSFPFGSAINSWKYVDPNLQKYRDWIHANLNWAVLENALKWEQLEPTQGFLQYDRAVKTLEGLKSHGLKIRGHNLVWSIDEFVPDYIKGQTGEELKATVRNHIQWTCNLTRGLVEHWDVNNENLHGFWFQRQLHDLDYELELFRETHAADPRALLFLNDYGVVAGGDSTGAYLAQARKFKAANVNMYGLGVQCHFTPEVEPSPTMIKSRLDTLAQVGVPIWATELTVEADDENKRADYYERALRALYGHEAVEGILFWGFWDQAFFAGVKAALVSGDNLDLTAAGRRVMDLFWNEWMTHETHEVSQANQQFTVRGFHGDYQVSVYYRNQELPALRQTFSLVKTAHTVDINITT
ncbi:LOW QUALITY PROTEIN: uncharacterized protein LOC112570470 [Pomacea canaliculata]|uniref:LOW QUALITY PROTEIN: uncharacterized protein LOC112570470 n=1 Tax=Pomacea canaliculata TaxID=400727 RepID=UPI000D72598D|nr:LOW QUALITY PROTEIN: uncharacterized protein LOC112570470 [Pomacea canaliculata]